MYENDIPYQMVSLAKKEEDDQQLMKDTMDAYIDLSAFKETHGRSDLELWYRVYNGEKIVEHYRGVEDPYGTLKSTNPLPLNDVKPWNIIRSDADIIINEKEKRPWNFQVVVKGPTTMTIIEEMQSKEYQEAMTQQYINILNANDFNTGVPTEKVQSAEQIQGKYKNSIRDERAKGGQNILKVALTEENIKHKLNRDGMKHWIIAGEVCTYKTILHNDFIYEIINPLNIDFILGPEVKYGRDGEAVVRMEMLPMSQIVTNFRDIIPEDELIELEKGASYKSDLPDSNEMHFIKRGEDNRYFGTLRRVIHCVWRSYKRVGLLTYIDEFEEEQSLEVDETFKEKEFDFTIISLEWEWWNAIMEGYKIDDEYYGIREIPWLARRADNKSIIPLPYNKVTYSDLNSPNTSIIKEAYIYQFYWNIYKAKLERLITTDKGKWAVVDKAVLAKWGLGEKDDFDKSLYLGEMTHMLFVDSRDENFNKFANWGASVDFGQHEAVSALLEVLFALRQELDQSMGITPQRKGDVKPSAGKGVTQEAIGRSYIISEGLFVDLENFEEIELNDILNIVKIVYPQSKQGMYIIDSMPITITGNEDLAEIDLGLHVSKASKDKVRLDAVKQLVQPFAQNVGKPGGTTPEMIIQMIDSENIPEIKEAMRKADEKQKQYEQSLREHEQNLKDKEIQGEKAEEDAKRVHESSESQLDRESEERRAHIMATGFEKETTLDEIDIPAMNKNSLERYKEENKKIGEQTKISFEKQEHVDDIKEAEKDRVHEKWMKRQDLKNPVVGEKIKK